MIIAVVVAAVIGLVCLLAGLALGWSLRRRSDWCPHCGDQLVCRSCGRRAGWPPQRATSMR